MERAEQHTGDDVVDELLFECLEQEDGDPRAALEALCAEHPAEAERLRARFAIAEGLGLVGLAASRPAAEVPDRLGDFRILERLGGGGMGVVYLAEQESLGREVALKLVRPELLWFDGARERFRREVTTIARLNHPGIVPVHAVGEEQGIPFFAMERVRGVSLADALERLERRAVAELGAADLRGADLARAAGAEDEDELAPLFRGGWTETCLRVALAVAEALEHAHRSGVLHRDVKPSNVMLTPEGRVMLVDFGLSSEQHADRITRSGSQVGSLAYMAPEVHEGEAADARADVYSLGVTLYELLTLRLPFEGRTATALAAAARAGRPAPLRARQPRASWEAETVCLVALEPERARRYASAAALARDLENVLEGRPLVARRPGALLRARRWVERHPARSVTAVLGTLAFVVAPLVIALRQHSANRALAARGEELRLANLALSGSLAEEAAQRALAERNFERAFEAVELMLSRVGSETLRDLPYMEEGRRQLLLDALRFHEELLAERPTDDRQRRTVARALLQAGDIQGYLGEHEPAERYLRRAVEAFVELDADDPTEPHAVERVTALYKLAQVLRDRGAFEEADAACRRVIDEIGESPDEGALFDVLARVRLELATSQRAPGELEGLVAELRARLARDPAATELEVLLARGLRRLGTPQTFFELDATDPTAARAHEALLEEAAELYERASDRLGTPGLSHELGGTCVEIGNARTAAGDFEGAHSAYQRANAVFDALRAGYPRVPTYIADKGNALYNLATLYMREDRLVECEPCFRAAGECYETLRALEPDNPDYAARCLLSTYQQAKMAVDLRADCDAALARLESLPALEEELAAIPRFAGLLRMASWNIRATRANCLADADAHVEAARAAREAGRLAGSPYQLGYAAGCLAECASDARADAALDDDAREALAGEYARDAVALLRSMIARGASEAELERALSSERISALHEDEAFIDLLVEYELERYLEVR